MKTLIKMQFNPEIAKKIGVEEAIMYSNIEYWCEKNKANNKSFYDGYFWTYNSKRAFTELFPFWTEDQISRILKNLEKKKYIKTGNYNKHKYDRTKWYAIIYQNPKSIMANTIMEKGKHHNGKGQTPEPIPYNKPYNNKNKKKISFSQEFPDKLLNKIINYYHKFITRAVSSGPEINSPGIKNLIREQLKTFKPEYLVMAILGFSRKENSEGEKWQLINNGINGITWFFKNSERLAQYLNFYYEKPDEEFMKQVKIYLAN